MEITETAGSSWYDSDARRVLREYESQSEMMDDIWRAFEHGWLPLSMTERREKRDDCRPGGGSTARSCTPSPSGTRDGPQWRAARRL